MKKFLLFAIVVLQVSCHTNKKEQLKIDADLVIDSTYYQSLINHFTYVEDKDSIALLIADSLSKIEEENRYFKPDDYLKDFSGIQNIDAVTPLKNKNLCYQKVWKDTTINNYQIKMYANYYFYYYSQMDVFSDWAEWDSYDVLIIDRDKNKVVDLYFNVKNVKFSNQNESGIHFTDITNNGKLNLILDIWNGGASCCSQVVVYEFDNYLERILDTDWIEGNHFFKEAKNKSKLDFVYWEIPFRYTDFHASLMGVKIVMSYDSTTGIYKANAKEILSVSFERLDSVILSLRDRWDKGRATKIALELWYANYKTEMFEFIEKVWVADFDKKEDFLAIINNRLLYRENIIALVKPIIENKFINDAKERGYELRVENDYFRCTCESENNNGIYFDEKTQEECMHSYNRHYIYFPEVPIIKEDIDNDGDIDFIVNYTLEGRGTIYANYDCIITNESGKFVYKLEK